MIAFASPFSHRLFLSFRCLIVYYLLRFLLNSFPFSLSSEFYLSLARGYLVVTFSIFSLFLRLVPSLSLIYPSCVTFFYLAPFPLPVYLAFATYSAPFLLLAVFFSSYFALFPFLFPVCSRRTTSFLFSSRFLLIPPLLLPYYLLQCFSLLLLLSSISPLFFSLILPVILITSCRPFSIPVSLVLSPSFLPCYFFLLLLPSCFVLPSSFSFSSSLSNSLGSLLA